MITAGKGLVVNLGMLGNRNEWIPVERKPGCLGNFKWGWRNRVGEGWGFRASLCLTTQVCGSATGKQRDQTRPGKAKSGALRAGYWGQHGQSIPFRRLIRPFALVSSSCCKRVLFARAKPLCRATQKCTGTTYPLRLANFICGGGLHCILHQVDYTCVLHERQEGQRVGK